MQDRKQKLLSADTQLDNPQGPSHAFDSAKPKEHSVNNRISINSRGSGGSSPQGVRVKKSKGGRQSLSSGPAR